MVILLSIVSGHFIFLYAHKLFAFIEENWSVLINGYFMVISLATVSGIVLACLHINCLSFIEEKELCK